MKNFNDYKTNKNFQKKYDAIIEEVAHDIDKERNQKRREKEAKHNLKKRNYDEEY